MAPDLTMSLLYEHDCLLALEPAVKIFHEQINTLLERIRGP